MPVNFLLGDESGEAAPSQEGSCRLCRERGQTWPGSPPKCAFLRGRFSEHNWNCGTVNAIRDLLEEGEVYQDDTNYGCIPVSDDEAGGFLSLWGSWYKRRGRTDELWLLGYGNEPTKPTEEDCLRILRAKGVLK